MVSLLGRGGMALVFLGRDPQLKRSIAIKVLAPSFAGAEAARARFTREAQAAATMTHPNIAAVYDVCFVFGQRRGSSRSSADAFSEVVNKRLHYGVT